MEVGDYVVTYTQEERGDRLPIDDTQGKWVARQRICLHLDKEDGGHSKIVLLRDAKWVREERVGVGGTVYLNMPEMGCVGHARVEAVEPCMVFLRWGNSSIRMVTGTFAHSAGLCGDLKLRGEAEPLGVTPLHPIWSEDRMDWIPAGELRPGETVKTIEGDDDRQSRTRCGTSRSRCTIWRSKATTATASGSRESWCITVLPIANPVRINYRIVSRQIPKPIRTQSQLLFSGPFVLTRSESLSLRVKRQLRKPQ